MFTIENFFVNILNPRLLESRLQKVDDIIKRRKRN